MSRSGKILAVVVGSLAVLLLGSTMLVAWTVATRGVVRIAVDDHEEGMRFDVPLPAALFEAGIGLMPLLARHHRHHGEFGGPGGPGDPGDHCRGFHGHRFDAEDYGPAVAAFLEGVADAPDATLVEVEDGPDHVRIVKEGRDIGVYVESPDADVHISMPAHLLHRTVRAAI
jgi:hypothetical protein